jgi:hypothetical protein
MEFCHDRDIDVLTLARFVIPTKFERPAEAIRE